MHIPHEVTVRDAAQLSKAVSVPQLLPRRVHIATSDSATHPQTFATTAAQLCGVLQAPHELTVRGTPQLSTRVRDPQFFPNRPQKAWFDSGAQPQRFGVMAPHV